jgi:hypothetical protein
LKTSSDRTRAFPIHMFFFEEYWFLFLVRFGITVLYSTDNN